MSTTLLGLRHLVPLVTKPCSAAKVNSKVPLTGQELEDHLTLEREEANKQREATQRAALLRSQQLLEADEGDSEDDDESDRDDDDDDDEMAVDKVLGGVDGGLDEDDLDHGERDPGARTVNSRPSAAQDWSMDDADAGRQLSFDIYLKGNVSKATSFFKTSSGATQRYRMYPYVDKSGGGMKRRVDEYGETLDVGMWLRRGRALDEDAESEEVKEAKRRKKEEDEAKVNPLAQRNSVTSPRSLFFRSPRKHRRNRRPSSSPRKYR